MVSDTKQEVTVVLRLNLEDFASLNRIEGVAERREAAEEEIKLSVEGEFEVVSFRWDE